MANENKRRIAQGANLLKARRKWLRIGGLVEQLGGEERWRDPETNETAVMNRRKKSTSRPVMRLLKKRLRRT